MNIRRLAKNGPKKFFKKIFVVGPALRLSNKLAAPGVVILRYHSIQPRPEQYDSTIGCESIHATSIFEQHGVDRETISSRNYGRGFDHQRIRLHPVTLRLDGYTPCGSTASNPGIRF